MEYAALIWDPYTKDSIQLLEAVQRRAARFVCNKYSRHESVTSMLQDLDWPLLEQRRAESRLTLFHRIVHTKVDINEHSLMERKYRAVRKGNSVQFRWPQTSKDCFKHSFIPHTISQWNAIPAGDDMPQFKSQIKFVDWYLTFDTFDTFSYIYSAARPSRSVHRCMPSPPSTGVMVVHSTNHALTAVIIILKDRNSLHIKIKIKIMITTALFCETLIKLQTIIYVSNSELNTREYF